MSKQFPIFCTVDVPSELLTTFLLQAHEPMNEGAVDKYSLPGVILRSPDLTLVEGRTPIPTDGTFPAPLQSPFPNWTVEQIASYLILHAPHTEVDEYLFIIIDARSLEDNTCILAHNEVKLSGTRYFRAVGRELKTTRGTFRDSLIALVNWSIANMSIEDTEGPGGLCAVGETEESIKRDREGGTWEERVLRGGKVVRDKV